MNKDKLGDEIMSEKELKLFVKNMKNYVATQKNTMTKDEARASLIRTDVLSKDGKTISEYQRVKVAK